MRLARTLLFQSTFYLTTLLYLLVCLPLLAFPVRYLLRALASYGRTCLWLTKQIAGIDLQIRGLEHLPKGPAIIAAKHQSTWETFALFPFVHQPVIIMKAELFRIPLHGWFARKFKMIPVRRGAGRAAIDEMVTAAKARLAEGRQIIIFPEGTRRPIGADPIIRNGVVVLYEQTNVPCIPVALNSGLFWPRRKLILHPGTITLSFLKPIPLGLPGAEFKALLAKVLEEETDQLIREALSQPNAPPISDAIRHRYGITPQTSQENG